jgi:hypothetical protein
MSYQIPKKSKAEFLLGETTSSMYLVKPTKVVKAKNAVVTMFIKGHVGSDFKMRINIYKDQNGSNVLLSSTAVNNLDIERTGDYYCEIRFDFGSANNRMAVGVNHLFEFEIYDGYTYDSSNYVALILDRQEAMGYVGSDVIHLESASTLGHRASFFFGEIEVQNNEKFFMMRLAGAKLMNGIVDGAGYDSDSKWLYSGTIQTNLYIDELIGGFSLTDYPTETSLNRVFDPIVVNVLDFSESLNDYYYNPESGEIQFYLDGALSSTFYAILNYYLFFTNYRGRYADPYMSELSLVTYWEPRLSNDLKFDFSQQNIFNGILSVSSSSIDIKNQDKYMNDFFSPNDSFSNREVICWSCEGETSNPTLEFVGTIRGVSINNDSCSFQVEDILSTLDNTYKDGLETYFSELAGYGTNEISVEDKNRVIPRMFGRCGPYDIELFDTGQAYAAGANYKIPILNGNKMTKFCCVSYNNASKTTSTNRTWSLGFGAGNATGESFDCTLHTHLVLSSFEASVLTLDVGVGRVVSEFFKVGDTFKNGSEYGFIYSVSATDIYVWPYNAAYSAANNVDRVKVPAVIIKDGDNTYYPKGTRDYVCFVAPDGDMCITFTNNFEANHSGMPTLDPDTFEVFGRMWNDDLTDLASDLLEFIISESGLTPSDDFIPAQNPSTPDAYVGRSYPDPMLSFTLPFAGDSELPTFREVIEKILKTTLGFIYFDNSGQVRFKSFLDSSYYDTDGVLTDSFIDNQSGKDPRLTGLSIRNSSNFSVNYDLYDLFSGVNFSFNHQPQKLLGVAGSFDYTEQVFGTLEVSLNIVKDFYKTNRKYEVESLADVDALYFYNYIEKYVNLINGRRASFNMQALDAKGVYIGDDLLVSRLKIVGSENESFMKIVSISKGVYTQALTLLDLKRFPTS